MDKHLKFAKEKEMSHFTVSARTGESVIIFNIVVSRSLSKFDCSMASSNPGYSVDSNSTRGPTLNSKIKISFFRLKYVSH